MRRQEVEVEMKVAIITPYALYRRWPTTPDTMNIVTNACPVTLPQLAAVLPGHEVRLFDGNVVRQPLRTFADLIRWADVVAINVMSSYAALNTELNVRFIKRLRPDLPVVLGGHHATFLDAQWLQRGVDAVVRREGEQTLPEVIEALAAGHGLDGIAGLSFLREGTVVRTPDRPFLPDLDALPMPRWDLLDLSPYHQYLRLPGHAACVETSRGCEQRCSFCQVGPMWRHTHRYKSPQRVVEELKVLKGQGVSQAYFVDDNYGSIADADRQSRLYRAMRDADVRLSWGCFFRHDYAARCPEVVKDAVAAGLRFVMIGYESTDGGDLGRFRKDNGAFEGVESYRRTYRFLRELGVEVFGFLIIGYPGQSLESAMRSVESWKGFCDYPVVTVYTPQPGTVGFNDTRCDGLLTQDMFYHDSFAVAVRGTAGVLSAYQRFFMRYLLDPSRTLPRLLGRDDDRRAMEVATLRWFATKVLSATPDNVADFVWLMRNRKTAVEGGFVEHLRRHYLCDSYVDRLAARFDA